MAHRLGALVSSSFSSLSAIVRGTSQALCGDSARRDSSSFEPIDVNLVLLTRLALRSSRGPTRFRWSGSPEYCGSIGKKAICHVSGSHCHSELRGCPARRHRCHGPFCPSLESMMGNVAAAQAFPRRWYFAASPRSPCDLVGELIGSGMQPSPLLGDCQSWPQRADCDLDCDDADCPYIAFMSQSARSRPMGGNRPQLRSGLAFAGSRG